MHNYSHMKRIYILLFCLSFVSGGAFAQSFTLGTRLVKVQGMNTKSQLDGSVRFTNVATDATDTNFTWEIISFTVPTNWQFQLCDMQNCQSNIGLGKTGAFFLKKGGEGDILVDFFPFNNTGNGSVQITVKSQKSNQIDTFTVTGYAWGTGVKENPKQQPKELSFFPNPAKDVLVVRYPTREAIEVEVFNVLGVKVRSFTLSGSETEVKIDDLKNGVYFIRFKDDGKTYSRSFTKVQ